MMLISFVSLCVCVCLGCYWFPWTCWQSWTPWPLCKFYLVHMTSSNNQHKHVCSPILTILLYVSRELLEPPDPPDPLAKMEQEEAVVRLVLLVALVRLVLLDLQDLVETRDLLVLMVPL